MSSPGILSDYLTRAELAKELRCSWRTVLRMEQLPDGLPSILLAGRKLYRSDAVKEWLTNRERRPNPRRTA